MPQNINKLIVITYVLVACKFVAKILLIMEMSDEISDVDDYSSDTNDGYSSDSNDDIPSISSESSADDQSSDENYLARGFREAKNNEEMIHITLVSLLYKNLLLPRISLRKTYVENIHRYIKLRTIKLDLLNKYFMYTSLPAMDITILVTSIMNVTYLLKEMMKRLPAEHNVELTVSDLFERITSYDGIDYLTNLFSGDSRESSAFYNRMTQNVLREYKKIKKELIKYDREE